MNCISAAETGFSTKRCTSDEQTPRPPSPAHHETFRPLHKYDSFAIPSTLRCKRVWSSNLSTQLRRTQSLNTVSNDACGCCGPQAIARLGTNLTSDDCTPHNVRKDTKPAPKPYMSMGSTAIPGGSAISSRGQTSFFAMAVVKLFALDKGCKWPKKRHFIDADIRPHFILCL